jgi:hypothetical protein
VTCVSKVSFSNQNLCPVKRAIALIVVVFFWFNSGAHGIDGCGSAHLNAGIGQIGQANFIGINYGLVFNKYSNQNIWGQQITERYTTNNINLGGRYFLSNKIAIRLNAVYNHSIVHLEGETLTQSGFGDTRIMLEFPLLNKCEGDKKSYVNLSAGIETPTGKSSDNIHLKAFAMGSGSWDFPFNLQGIFGTSQKAIAFSAIYQINRFNQHHYRFGNQLTVSINGIKTVDFRSFKLNLGAGAQFLQFSNDIYDNGIYHNVYSNRFSALMTNAMIQLDISNTTVQLGYNLPLLLNSNSTSDLYFQWLNVGLFRRFN